MSQTKPQIGSKLKYKYDNKWYKAEIIELSSDTIIIKVWKSILKPKIVYVAKSKWKQVISSTKKIDKIILFDDNVIFPEWVRVSQIVIVHDDNFMSSKSTPQIAKIIHYKDGNYITVQYIRYNDYKNPYYTQPKKLITQTIEYIPIQMKTQFMQIYPAAIKFGPRKVLFPYYNAFENDTYFDMIQELNNVKVMKRLSKNNENDKSSQHKNLDNVLNHAHDTNNYICNSKLQYGSILYCKTFPYDINKLLVSFLAQKMIYICPPTPCCKLKKVPPSWQFTKTNCYYSSYRLAIIGCEFVLNKDLIINGFELNHIEMLGLHQHEIHLCDKEFGIGMATQIELKQHRTDAQYMFPIDENKGCVTLKKDKQYTVKIKVNANVPCYQWHESVLRMSTLKQKYHNDKQMVVKEWKCFKKIAWMKFDDNSAMTWFPHFAFLLP